MTATPIPTPATAPPSLPPTVPPSLPPTAPPTESVIPSAPSLAELAQPVCANVPGVWCQRFYDWTSNDFLAQSANAIMSTGFTTLLIIAFAVLARFLLHRAISRLIEGATSQRVSRIISRRTRPQLGESASAPVTPRRAQRARTIGSVLRSASSILVGLVAAVMVLAEFNVSLGPILASAGIVGLAVGFGAQNLVRDFLTGMFMLLEDQYGVGDIVDVGAVSGTVEAVGLRITTLRDINGTVWYVRNGEILRVGNRSQGFAVAIADVPLALGADIRRATEIAGRTAAEVVADADLAEVVTAEPEVVGIERIGIEGVTFRVTVRTVPGEQYRVQRALVTALSRAFDEDGLPHPGAVAPGGQ